MAPKAATSSTSSPSNQQQQQRLHEMEAKAVDKAKAHADAAYRPSNSVLNAPSASVLLQQVDGPSLQTYQGTESVYVGRSVPVGAGATLNVPIHVSTPGSVVECAVELKAYDLEFTITAEREEGVTMVKDCTRIQSTDSPVTQKFLVGTVPCLLNFDFGNGFSWVREKVVSYKITVTPPGRDSLAAGRRRRAKACLAAVAEDLTTAQRRRHAATQSKTTLQQHVAELTQKLEERQKAMRVAEKEEAWLLEREALRVEQQKQLKHRLDHGWDDEKETGGR